MNFFDVSNPDIDNQKAYYQIKTQYNCTLDGIFHVKLKSAMIRCTMMIHGYDLTSGLETLLHKCSGWRNSCTWKRFDWENVTNSEYFGWSTYYGKDKFKFDF